MPTAGYQKCEECDGAGETEYCSTCGEVADNCECEECASDMRECEECNGTGETEADPDAEESKP